MADLFKRIAARLFGSSRPPEWLTLPAWKAEPLFDVSAMSDCRDPQVRVDLSTYTIANSMQPSTSLRSVALRRSATDDMWRHSDQ